MDSRMAVFDLSIGLLQAGISIVEDGLLAGKAVNHITL